MHSLKIIVYMDKSGRWRWRTRRGNSAITADSGQSYARKSDAIRAGWSLIAAAKNAVVSVAL